MLVLEDRGQLETDGGWTHKKIKYDELWHDGFS